MSQARLNNIYASIEQQGLAAIVLNAGPSLNYLTGLQFHLMERPVVMIVAPGKEPVIILPELEQLKLEKLDYSVQSFAYGENPDLWQETFNNALEGLALKGRKIGVEPRQLRLLEYTYLRGAVDADFIDGAMAISSLRARKDSQEIAHMRKAVEIAENALKATLPMIKIGVNEKEIAGELFMQLIRNGSETALPFSPIVAAGPNGANPHAKPSTRPIAEGDLLVIDWGARFNGYASDLTRTFAIGKIGEEAGKIHKAVQAANRAGREAAAPGVACAAVDKAARDVIEAAGYGEFFTHRTGHGIGMECHEDPYIHGTNEHLLEEGNCYTVEPGIYLSGRNGVRIEDDVVVTANGAESLSTMSRDIVVLG